MCEVAPGKCTYWLGQRDSQLGGLSMNVVSVAVDISSSLLTLDPAFNY